jgi:hypothetical protein
MATTMKKALKTFLLSSVFALAGAIFAPNAAVVVVEAAAPVAVAAQWRHLNSTPSRPWRR